MSIMVTLREGDDAPVRDRGCTGHFSPLKKMKNNPRPGHNLVLKIDLTGAYFGLGQILAQNNPRPGQNRGCTGHFSTLEEIKNNLRPGQNLH